VKPFARLPPTPTTSHHANSTLCCRYYQLPTDVIWPGGNKGAPIPEDLLALGLLLPVTGSWRGGRTIAGAAALAVQRINADSSLLGGMRVEYAWADAGCGVKSGVDALAMLLGSNRLDAVIGPGAHASASLLASVGM